MSRVIKIAQDTPTSAGPDIVKITILIKTYYYIQSM
jgi:hypothetical protein